MTEQSVKARERLERDAADFLRGACPEDVPQFVTNCIAIVREALLSDDAVAAVDGIWKFPTKGMERTNRMRLAASLDAVFGEEVRDE